MQRDGRLRPGRPLWGTASPGRRTRPPGAALGGNAPFQATLAATLARGVCGPRSGTGPHPVPSSRPSWRTGAGSLRAGGQGAGERDPRTGCLCAGTQLWAGQADATQPSGAPPRPPLQAPARPAASRRGEGGGPAGDACPRAPPFIPAEHRAVAVFYPGLYRQRDRHLALPSTQPSPASLRSPERLPQPRGSLLQAGQWPSG